MSKTKRKRYSAGFKAKVALDAIKGEQTISELGTKYGLHPNMITNWKRQAVENQAETFSTKAERIRTDDDPQIKELHAKTVSSLWNGIFYPKPSVAESDSKENPGRT